jgi:hypothetical protein
LGSSYLAYYHHHVLESEPPLGQNIHPLPTHLICFYFLHKTWKEVFLPLSRCFDISHPREDTFSPSWPYSHHHHHILASAQRYPHHNHNRFLAGAQRYLRHHRRFR